MIPESDVAQDVETPAARRARLQAELAALDADHPLPPAQTVEGAYSDVRPAGEELPTKSEPEAIPDHVLESHFQGASLGTWLLRLKAIFETGYYSHPLIAGVEHKPAE